MPIGFGNQVRVEGSVAATANEFLDDVDTAAAAGAGPGTETRASGGFINYQPQIRKGMKALDDPPRS